MEENNFIFYNKNKIKIDKEEISKFINYIYSKETITKYSILNINTNNIQYDFYTQKNNRISLSLKNNDEDLNTLCNKLIFKYYKDRDNFLSKENKISYELNFSYSKEKYSIEDDCIKITINNIDNYETILNDLIKKLFNNENIGCLGAIDCNGRIKAIIGKNHRIYVINPRLFDISKELVDNHNKFLVKERRLE